MVDIYKYIYLRFYFFLRKRVSYKGMYGWALQAFVNSMLLMFIPRIWTEIPPNSREHQFGDINTILALCIVFANFTNYRQPLANTQHHGNTKCKWTSRYHCLWDFFGGIFDLVLPSLALIWRFSKLLENVL